MPKITISENNHIVEFKADCDHCYNIVLTDFIIDSDKFNPSGVALLADLSGRGCYYGRQICYCPFCGRPVEVNKK